MTDLDDFDRDGPLIVVDRWGFQYCVRCEMQWQPCRWHSFELQAYGLMQLLQCGPRTIDSSRGGETSG